MELLFASQNKNKLNEIQSKLDSRFLLKSLTDYNYKDPLPETGKTLIENALQKARFVYNLFKKDCFADDSGLEIEALNCEPGVDSAHYSGERNDTKNMDLVLNKLNHQLNRRSKFITVFALIINGNEFIFIGEIKGVITEKKIGTNGFGYDPVFIPDGFDKTFAQMSIIEKNAISHRGIALKKMIEFLATL